MKIMRQEKKTIQKKNVMSAIIELFRNYETLLQKESEPVSLQRLSKFWEMTQPAMTNYANSKRQLPLWRIVWAYNRYRKLGITSEEILEAIRQDYPSDKVEYLLETYHKA